MLLALELLTRYENHISAASLLDFYDKLDSDDYSGDSDNDSDNDSDDDPCSGSNYC